MEINKLNRKEEPDLRDILKNSYSENLISLLQTIKKYCSRDGKKNIRAIFRIMSNSYSGAFFAKIVNGWMTLFTSARNTSS